MHSLVSPVTAYSQQPLVDPLLWAAGCLACWIIRSLGSRTAHKVWIAVLFAAVLVPSFPLMFG